MENQNSNLGLNLPTNPPNGATPFNQFSPYLPPPKPTAIEEPTFLECCSNFLNSKKVIEVAIWLVLMILLIPSGMAVASWNAVPGDFTYSWKTGLEKGLLLVLRPSKTLQTSTQVALTQRRYAEAAKLLKGDQAQLGLKNLSEQVETTSDSIQSLSAGSSKTAFTMQYIEALTELNEKLEQEKKQHQGAEYQPSTPTAQKPGTPQPKAYLSNGGSAQGGGQAAGGVIIHNTYVQNTIIQTVTSVPGAPVASQPIARPLTPPIDDVTTEIIQAQEQIQNTIAELQTHTTTLPLAQPTSAPAQNPTEAPAPKAAAPKAAEPPADNTAPASNEAPAPKAAEPQSSAPKAEEPKDDSNKGSNDNSGSSNSGSGSGSGSGN